MRHVCQPSRKQSYEGNVQEAVSLLVSKHKAKRFATNLRSANLGAVVLWTKIWNCSGFEWSRGLKYRPQFHRDTHAHTHSSPASNWCLFTPIQSSASRIWSLLLHAHTYPRHHMLYAYSIKSSARRMILAPHTHTPILRHHLMFAYPHSERVLVELYLLHTHTHTQHPTSAITWCLLTPIQSSACRMILAPQTHTHTTPHLRHHLMFAYPIQSRAWRMILAPHTHNTHPPPSPDVCLPPFKWTR